MIARRSVLIGAAAMLAPVGRADAVEMITPAARDWRFIADGVMGGVSQGQAVLEGAGVRLTGTVSTENNGGFLQVRTDLPDGAPEAATGLRIRVRGNGARYFIHLRNRSGRAPWQFHQAGFDTGTEFAEIDLPFARFEPRGGLRVPAPVAGDITSLALVAYGADYAADVTLAGFGWISG
ncbi:MAG: CIA30 family protein [Rhodobacteraceae bacterium]|nr:CIA30 family protein [Paracoccaceae bacterium]